MNDLRALFPGGEQPFRLTMRRGDPGEFFRPRDPTGTVLRERARWIDQTPGRYTAESGGFRDLLEELSAWGAAWALPAVKDAAGLGRMWEPDVLLLSRGEDGAFRLRGGALCFPSGWALEEKLGLTLPEIHGVVPGLNPAIGRAIDQFLGGLRPGPAFLRDNWGIAATAELNLHPARVLPGPVLPVQLDQLWLRVEHQALVALPSGRGLGFGIRIALHRLDRVAADPELASALAATLRALPPELARYKRLDAIGAELTTTLGG